MSPVMVPGANRQLWRKRQNCQQRRQLHIIASGENSTVVSTGVVDSLFSGQGEAPHWHIMTAKEFARRRH